MTTTKWRTAQDPYHVTIWENLCTMSTGIDDAGSGKSFPALRSSQGQTQSCFLAKMYLPSGRIVSPQNPFSRLEGKWNPFQLVVGAQIGIHKVELQYCSSRTAFEIESSNA